MHIRAKEVVMMILELREGEENDFGFEKESEDECKC
jgi:hypothetical protein